MWLGIIAVCITLGHLLLGLVCSFLGIFIADFSNLNSTATSVMPRNFGIFKLITTAHGLGSLNIQVFVLAAVEALNVVLGQATLGAAHTRHTLHEADHGLPTVRVEGSVVAGVNISHQKSLLILNWVCGQRRLGIVSEVGDKSLSILQFNLKCLIINGGPLAGNRLPTGALLVAAVRCLGLIVIVEVYFDGISLCKVEIHLGCDDLDTIGHLM